ncbi:hypothetical protein DOY81_005586 [Sarcophaga bullata]|nr:hypothetical protein DOY81_005586 [Sarcophaga bullata]
MPYLESNPLSKSALKSPPKPHIVADDEDTNGMAVSSVKSSVQLLQTPAKKSISSKDDFYKKSFEYAELI